MKAKFIRRGGVSFGNGKHATFYSVGKYWDSSMMKSALSYLKYDTNKKDSMASIYGDIKNPSFKWPVIIIYKGFG